MEVGKEMKKSPFVLIIIVVVFLAIGFLVQTTPTAPDHARIIIDHTHKVYASPPCFDQADLTNFLDETTLAQAINLGYQPESSCTSQSLVAQSQPILFHLFGFSDVPWGKDGQW